MNKRFRCGRLMLTKDGVTKKIDLGDGGGTRSCDWNSSDMTFQDVHTRLVNIFNLNYRKDQTSLYDFQHRRINMKQYQTFGEYINQYGLNGNSTVVYLCTNEDDMPRNSWVKNKNSSHMTSSTFKQKTSTSSIEYTHAVRNEPHHHQQQNNQSSFEYSYVNSSTEMMKNIRELISQNGVNQVLIQLFEYICIIYGYISSRVNSLQQLNQQSDQDTIYLDKLNEICVSTKTLLNVNMEKFDHLQMFSIIRSKFNIFYSNIQILRNRLPQNFGNKNNNDRINTTSTSFDSLSIHSSAEDHCERHQENSNKSSAHQLLPLTPSHEPPKEETNEKFSLFRTVLANLHHLLRLVRCKGLTSFYGFISLILTKIKSMKFNVNILDESSICDSKRIIVAIRDDFSRKFKEQNISPSTSEADRMLNKSCENTLRSIRFLLSTFYRYQMKIYHQNQQHTSN